ncbi:MAG: EAL domain-containing protein [Acidimicrobiia bacterium]|nr:EAL domain-containing protein [Acidimicrobiia bacterium]
MARYEGHTTGPVGPHVREGDVVADAGVLWQAFDRAHVGRALAGLYADGTSRFLHVNPAFAGLTGASRDVLLGMGLDDVRPPEEREAFARLRDEILGGVRDGYEAETRYVHPDGEEQWVREVTTAVRDGVSGTLQMVVTVEDTTDDRLQRERNRIVAAVSGQLTLDGADVESAAQQAAQELALLLGDGCKIDVVDRADRTLRLVGFAHRNPDAASLARQIMEQAAPQRIGEGLAGRAVDTGEEICSGHVDDPGTVWRPETAAYHVRYPTGALICVPMGARGGIVGALTMVRVLPARPYSDAEVETVRAVADKVGAVVASIVHQAERRRMHDALAESQARVSAVLDTAVDAIFTSDEQGTIESVNASGLKMFGYDTEADLVGRDVALLMPESDSSRHGGHMRRYLDSGEAHIIGIDREVLARRRDGTVFPVDLAVSEINLGGRRVFTGFIRDITERKKAEHALSRAAALLALSEQRFRSTFEEAPVGMALVEIGAGSIVNVNNVFCELARREADDLLDRVAVSLVHAGDRTEFRSLLNDVASGGAPRGQTELRLVDGAGDIHWVRLSMSTIPAVPDEERYVVMHAEDVTARRTAEEKLTWLALYDPLTQLANRTLLLDHLALALNESERRPQSGVCVLYVDIDDFKYVNDTFGHTAGDRVLVEVARRLRRELRAADTAARVGGDEFVVVCGGVGEADPEAIATRITRAVARPMRIEEAESVLTVSVGIAVGAGGDDPAELIRAADTAMYRAKTRGKNCWEMYTQALQEAGAHRVETAHVLRHALDTSGLRLDYQPIVDLGTDAVIGAEALLRVRDPAGRELAPVSFLDVAEDTGLIVPLGEWVIQSACRQFCTWREGGQVNGFRLSVNLSTRQLLRPETREVLVAVLHGTAVDPSDVCLEITETAALHTDRVSRRLLDRLAEDGFHLAIDDFGTGYGGFTYLHDLPVDTVKVDRSFVAGLGTHARDLEIVRSIVALAEALGLMLVAEGVETASQRDTLLDLGCRYAQGFALHRPQPPAALTALLEGQIKRDT